MSVPKDLNQVKRDIQRARTWARKYFNVEGPDGFLDPPAFGVEFPEPDQMVVYPRLWGKRMSIGVEYRLKWEDDSVGWEGYHVLTGKPTCQLEVPREAI